jgi:hypothetical protein
MTSKERRLTLTTVCITVCSVWATSTEGQRSLQGLVLFVCLYTPSYRACAATSEPPGWWHEMAQLKQLLNLRRWWSIENKWLIGVFPLRRFTCVPFRFFHHASERRCHQQHDSAVVYTSGFYIHSCEFKQGGIIESGTTSIGSHT